MKCAKCKVVVERMSESESDTLRRCPKCSRVYLVKAGDRGR